MWERLFLAAIATLSLYFFLQVGEGYHTSELLNSEVMESSMAHLSSLIVRK